MAEQILNAFSHQRAKTKLKHALAQAQGDLGWLCHVGAALVRLPNCNESVDALLDQSYLPVAIDVCARVVSRFGFTEGIEGVKESIRVLQTQAKDDDVLVQHLISIRKLFTPTGAWIVEDNDAAQEDLRREELDQQALLQKKKDERREGLLALENTKKARLRAKKIAMGLDPSVERPPILLDAPPAVIAAKEGAQLELRVNVKYVQTFQWYFNGRALEVEELVSGVHRCTLVIAKLSKRASGDYYCICENEEGAVSTSTCRVGIATLRLSRLGSRDFGTLTSSPLYDCDGKMAITCVGSKIVLYDVKTLVPAKAFPTLPAPMETITWDAQSKTIAAFCSVHRPDKCDQALQLFLYPAAYASAGSSSGISTTLNGGSRRRESSRLGLGVPTKPKASTIPRFQLADVQTIEAVADVHAAGFIDSGRRLVISDMRHHVALYDLSPHFTLKAKIGVGKDIVCHIAVHPGSPILFALVFRNKRSIKLIHDSTDAAKSGTLQEHHLDFKFPVHRAAFDALGFFVAVAEAGFMKSWISIVNVNTKKCSRRRFIAHVGNISELQWTTQTSLLVSSSYDGYVKIWDPVAMTPLLNVHMDAHGIHAMRVVEHAAILLVVGHSDRRLQSRTIVQLQELETSRLVEMNQQAATIQKIWKGRKTRELIAKYIKAPKT